MRNYLDSLAGGLMVVSNNRMNRRTLRKIQEANAANQGIVRYSPSQVEAFIDDTVPVENMLFSGGDNSIRVRATIRAIECACLQGYSILVMHCGNTELEQGLNNYFGAGYVITVNRNNPIYDPFAGASNDEIARLVVLSASKNNKINTVGRHYLSGVSDYIRCNHKSPRCYMFIKCPHMELIDRINKAESSGRLRTADANMIVSQILQGEAERGNIEQFFYELSLQGSSIMAQKANASYAVNFMTAAHNQSILSVDVQSNSNALLTNLLVNETESVISQGNKVFIVADGLQLNASDSLFNYVKHCGSNNGALVCADDTYALFGGSDNDFFAFVGKCSKLIISKHSSAYSCQKLSDILGSYDKQEISSSLSQNVSYFGRWGGGTSQTSNISIKRENIVKPEEIQRMKSDEVFIMDKQTGELSLAPII